jgi:hypothetical protein
MNQPIRSRLPLALSLLALVLLTGACNRFDGFSMTVVNDPGFSTYLVSRSAVEMTVGQALIIEVKPAGNDDPADLRLVSRDERILRIDPAAGQRLVFVAAAPGETRINVRYKGSNEDTIPVTVVDQP